MLYLKNLLLCVFTLGIYSFWGKVRIRRFFSSHTYVQGEPLEYTARGGQLFIGFIVGSLLLGAVFAVVMGIGYLVSPILGQIVLVSIMLVASPYLVFRSLRFNLAHTRLRGVAFGLDGSPLQFAGRAIVRILITIATVGIMGPWALAHTIQDLAQSVRYGSAPFSFEGSAMGLVKAALLPLACLFGVPLLAFFSLQLLPFLLVLGVVMAALFWNCAVRRWIASGLRFGQGTFHCAITPGKLLGALFTYGLIVGLTAGIGYAWAEVRWRNFLFEQYSTDTENLFVDVPRGEEQQEALGEGLAQAFDVDLGF